MKQISFILALLSPLAIFSQTSYFVSDSGDNANNGLATGTPFKTITYAATVANHGDTIFVLPGTYTNDSYGSTNYWKEEQTVKINNKNSTSGSYLTIKPYLHELVKIKGDGNFIVQIRNSSYIKFEGFEIEGETEKIPLELALEYQFAFRSGTNTEPTLYRCPIGTNTDQTNLSDISSELIFRPSFFNTHGIVIQSSHHIEINKNLVHHIPGEGIRFVSSDYIRITGNEVHNCARKSSSGVHGISCYTLSNIDENDGIKNIIAQNKVHDNYCEIASWSEKKTIFTATIDEGKGITVQRSTSTNGWNHGRILIENNIAYHNGLSGIHINSGDRINIINNTVYNNSRYGSGNNIGISIADGNEVLVHNNIIESPTSWGGFSISMTPSSSNVVISHNVVQGATDTDATAITTQTINADPLFADPETFDFHLQSTSPAINAALANVAPSIDYYGNSRTLPDIGAIEYPIDAAIDYIAFPQSDPFAFPNPANDVITLKGGQVPKIFAISGQRIMPKSIEMRGESMKMDVSNLAQGIYCLQMGNGRAIKMVIHRR